MSASDQLLDEVTMARWFRTGLIALAAGVASIIITAAITRVSPVQPRIRFTSSSARNLIGMTDDGDFVATVNVSHPQNPHRAQVSGPLQVFETLSGRERAGFAKGWDWFEEIRSVAGGQLLALRHGRELVLCEPATAAERRLPDTAAEHPLPGGSVFRYRLFRSRGFEISPIGDVIAFVEVNYAASNADLVKLWDVHANHERATLDGATGVFAFSPDGRIFATGGNDNSVLLWEAATGKKLATLKGHSDKINYLVFSPDGKRLASAQGNRDLDSQGKPGQVIVWDVASRQEVNRVTCTHTGIPQFTHNGQGLILGRSFIPQRASSWDLTVRPAREVDRWPSETRVYSEDGQRCADISRTGTSRTLSLIDCVTQSKLRDHVIPDQGKPVHDVHFEFSPDGRTLVITCANLDEPSRFVVWLSNLLGRKLERSTTTLVKICDASTGAVRADFKFQGLPQVKCSPDGRLLATLDDSGAISIWDIPPKRPSRLAIGSVLIVALAVVLASGMALRRGWRWLASGKQAA